MRFINIKLFILAAILSLTSISAIADNKSGRPLTCAPASTVAKLHMVYAERDEDPNYWIVLNVDAKAILSATWIYGALIPVNQAVDAQDAINKVNAVLPTARSITKKLVKIPPTRFVGCGYTTSGDYLVVGFTHLHQ